jgi:hypothetical protein
MNIKTIQTNNQTITVVQSDEVIINDVPSALDFMATVQYEAGCSRIAVYKESITDDFFILSTRLAGEVLQKFINYGVKLAIIGDFSYYTSKPLKDFMYESNHGRDIFFVPDEDAAVERLGAV